MKGSQLTRRAALAAVAALALAACGKRPDRLKAPADPDTGEPADDRYPRRYPTS